MLIQYTATYNNKIITFLTKGDISAADSLMAGSMMGTITGTRMEERTRRALALVKQVIRLTAASDTTTHH